MRKNFPLFGADADMWERDGLSLEDEDALVLALWHYYRGRPNTDTLSTCARLVYSPLVKRWEAEERITERKSAAGRLGGLRTQAKIHSAKAPAQAIALAPLEPTSTSTTTSTSKTSTPTTKFVKPTEDEVRKYCEEQGYGNVNPADFIDYYESNGWMIGKAKMKDWKRTVNRWHRMHQKKSGAVEPSPTFGEYKIRL